MVPVTRLGFTAAGALVGAKIGPGGAWFFAALVGACIGFALAEFTLVRGRILSLEEEIARLRASLERPDTEAPAPARASIGEPASIPAHASMGDTESIPAHSPSPGAHRRPATQF